MAGTPTTTAQLTRALPYVIGSARIVREFEGVMVRLSERHSLSDGTGLDWNEIALGQLNAQSILETTELNNPQVISETLLTITPVMVGIQTIITDKTMRRISPLVAGQIGKLAQNAIQRLKDERGLTLLDSATTSLVGAGSTLSFGHITAAVNRIRSNTTEPAVGPIYTVLHGFQIKDLQDEIVQGVGTYAIPSGLTEEVYRNGFAGSIANSEVYEDGNITIDSTDDAKGGVFAREGVLLIDGFGPKVETDRLIRVGGGASEMIIYDEFAYGERSAGNWLYEIYSDALAPTA